ncbi:MAG: hypothetical protein ACF8TS_07870 [Maioricimonas sp. JB049]
MAFGRTYLLRERLLPPHAPEIDMHARRIGRLLTGILLLFTSAQTTAAGELKLSWQKNILTVSGPDLPGDTLEIWYLEAYCRPGSTDRVWNKTTIGHETKLIEAADDGSRLVLQCRLNDGVIVDHVITATDDAIDFRLTARNPTDTASLAHWAQPCVRVGRFTGRMQADYLPKCFVFIDGELTRMPTPVWATEARYTPGQVWAPRGVDRNDVNPRPLNPQIPSNGLIGCFSADESKLLAMAWEPYQELFQGVIVCVHSDFRIGGLQPGETKQIRGRLYVMDADVDALLKRYADDFPEQTSGKTDEG